MLQMSIPNMEEDLLACALRREKGLVDQLIHELEIGTIPLEHADERLREIENGLRKLCSE